MFSIDDKTESLFDNLVKYLESIKTPEIPVKKIDPIDRDWEPQSEMNYYI